MEEASCEINRATPFNNSILIWFPLFRMGGINQNECWRRMAPQGKQQWMEWVAELFALALNGISWFWLIRFIGGLWALQRPMAPPREANINKQNQQFNSTKLAPPINNKLIFFIAGDEMDWFVGYGWGPALCAATQQIKSLIFWIVDVFACSLWLTASRRTPVKSFKLKETINIQS